MPEAGPGDDYGYLLPERRRSAARSPVAVAAGRACTASSRVYDHSAFAWTDQRWTGRQLPGSVLYELHVGTFTAEGTFDAAIDRLDHLVDLGVDLVELLPVERVQRRIQLGLRRGLLVRAARGRTAARTA